MLSGKEIGSKRADCLPRILGAILLTLSLVHPASAQAGTTAYPNPPQRLRERVESVASDVADNRTVDALAASWNKMALDVVADALMSRQNLTLSRNLAETARTDKQVGAGATASGSTTLVEKAGLPLFLAFALEHGALQQEVNGTSVTLSFSPSGLLRLRRESETPATMEQYEFWHRLSFSASFNVEDSNAPPLSNVNGKQLTELSARFRLLGNRSGRSKHFTQVWKEIVQPRVQRELDLISGLLDEIDQDFPELIDFSLGVKDRLLLQIDGWLTQNRTAAENAVRNAVEEQIWEALRTQLFEPVRDATLEIPADLAEKIIQSIQQRDVLLREQAEARANLPDLLETLNQPLLLTFAYTAHRTTLEPDYSEFKLLFERHIAPLDVVANAGISVFSDPDPTRGQSRIRDFHASLSLEGTARNPFRFETSNDQSRLTYALSGRYERMRETRLDIGVVQFRVQIPIASGLALPVALTYANRTEFVDENEVRGNFGLSFDVDKLYALTRSVMKQ